MCAAVPSAINNDVEAIAKVETNTRLVTHFNFILASAQQTATPSELTSTGKIVTFTDKRIVVKHDVFDVIYTILYQPPPLRQSNNII